MLEFLQPTSACAISQAGMSKTSSSDNGHFLPLCGPNTVYKQLGCLQDQADDNGVFVPKC